MKICGRETNNMGTFFAYTLKAALCLIAYYLFYKLLFSKETFHRFNRIALVSLMLLSLVLPFVHFGISGQASGAMDVEGLVAVGYSAAGIADTKTQVPLSIQIVAWAMILYLAGVVAMAIRSLVVYVSLARVLRQGRTEDNSKYGLPSNIRLIVHDKAMSPFSWMNYIVVSENDLNEASESILAHEMGHVSNHHTLDLIFTEVCLIFQWFNPAMWLMRQELQAIHEYEADEAVLDYGVNAKQYQLLIIKKAAGSRLQSITNSLHQSSIKKRITMMLKQKSNPWAKAKFLVALPLAVLCVSCLSSPEASEISDQVSAGKVSDIFANMQENGAKKTVYLSYDAKNNTAVTIIASVDEDGKQTTYPVTDEELKDIYAKDGSLSLVVDRETPMQYVTDFKERLRKLEINRVSYNSLGEDGKVKSDPNGANPNYKSDEDAFTVVEEQPEFPGGEKELMVFIKNSLKYPADCVEEGVQGRVTLSFVVDKDGSVVEPKVMRSPDDRLTAEAIRIVESMPKWKPGRQDGEVVRVKYVLPVTFRLQ